MPERHPAGPFAVIVRAYRIAPYVDQAEHAPVFLSRHKSAAGAARRLGQVISRRNKLGDACRQAIPRDFAGQYVIRIGDGSEYALVPFRKQFCK